MADEEEIWDGNENWQEGQAALAWTEANKPVQYDINPKAYSKWPLDRFVAAAQDGDLDLLGMMLNREDPINGYHADINRHVSDVNALHAAAVNGQLEAVEMLLRAKADPHVKTSVPYGRDPKEGETARDMADKWGWDDIVEVLKKAEAETPKGLYRKYGPGNNAKLWPIDRPQGLDPAQEKRCQKLYKGLVRPVPNKADRKFYGDAVYGVTHGYDENGKAVRGWQLPARQAGLAQDAGSVVPWAPKDLPDVDTSFVPTKIGLLFPGRGSQYVSMMDDAARIPKVQEMLEDAEKILGFDLLEVCLRGPESKLEETGVCLPAVYVAGLAAVEKLRAQKPEAVERPGALAGLSIGEFTALTVAGVWGFQTGLSLVKVCADAVAEVARGPPQATLSIAGVEKPRLEEHCAQVREKTGAVCQIASELFPKGFTCAGSLAAMEQLQELAVKGGALQSRILTVYGAAHTPFMEPAREKLRLALTEALPKMQPPRCDVYMNSTGRAVRRGTRPEELIPLLCDQLTSPVLWQKSVDSMINFGMEEFYEVGPMKQLKAMMKRIDASSWSRMANVEV